MKKNIIFGIGAWLCAFCLFSCSSDLDVVLEKDNATTSGNPYTTINQYVVTGNYNPDNDTRLRFTFNDNVNEAYCLLELSSKKEAYIAENGKDAYMLYVVENGTKLNIDKSTQSVDTLFVNIAGKHDITVVSLGANNTMNLAAVSFTGLVWTDVCTGSYRPSVLVPAGIPPILSGKKLQVCDSDPNLYRIPDLYKAGYHLKFRTIDVKGEDEDGVYSYIRVEPQETGLSYGDLGNIRIQDIGYWQGNDSFVLTGGYQGGIYDDNNIFFFVQYSVPAGNLGYDYEFFVPDEE